TLSLHDALPSSPPRRRIRRIPRRSQVPRSTPVQCRTCAAPSCWTLPPIPRPVPTRTCRSPRARHDGHREGTKATGLWRAARPAEHTVRPPGPPNYEGTIDRREAPRAGTHEIRRSPALRPAIGAWPNRGISVLTGGQRLHFAAVPGGDSTVVGQRASGSGLRSLLPRVARAEYRRPVAANAGRLAATLRQYALSLTSTSPRSPR